MMYLTAKILEYRRKQKKKLIAIMLVSVLSLAFFNACGTKIAPNPGDDADAAADKLTVGICMPTKEQTIWTIQGERLTEAFQTAVTKRSLSTRRTTPPSRLCRLRT